jgi:hypothetical protein
MLLIIMVLARGGNAALTRPSYRPEAPPESNWHAALRPHHRVALDHPLQEQERWTNFARCPPPPSCSTTPRTPGTWPRVGASGFSVWLVVGGLDAGARSAGSRRPRSAPRASSCPGVARVAATGAPRMRLKHQTYRYILATAVTVYLLYYAYRFFLIQ